MSQAEWTQVAQKHHEVNGPTELTTNIISAVAAAENDSVLNIKSPSLYDVFDATSLEQAFFSSERTDDGTANGANIEFSYYGYRIVIQPDGWIRVFEAQL